MNAAILNRYGDESVLEYQKVPKPIITSPTQLLVQVKAAGVNPVDFKVRKGFLAPILSLPFPAILGIDFSGIVIDKGETNFNVGDQVYGKLEGIQGKGTYAEFVLVDTKKDAIYQKPKNWSFEECCIGVVLLTAYIGIVVHGQVKEKDKVLVIGGSGAVGAFAIQIAKSFDAHVTSVNSTKNNEYVTSLGADECIDYHSELSKLLNLEFDTCLDCVGGDEYYELVKVKRMYSTAVGPSKYGGSEPMSIVKIASLIGKLGYRSLFGKYKFISSLPIPDFKIVDEFIRDGKVKPIPVVMFPLKEVGKAHEASSSNRTVGKIVLVP